jgi:hypothetical protein
MGSIPVRAVAVGAACRMDLAGRRALGLGPLSLWKMGASARTWLGMGAGHPFELLWRLQPVLLSVEAGAGSFLQLTDLARHLHSVVSAHARRTLAQARSRPEQSQQPAVPVTSRRGARHRLQRPSTKSTGRVGSPGSWFYKASRDAYQSRRAG